jgi:hypothetical protein
MTAVHVSLLGIPQFTAACLLLHIQALLDAAAMGRLDEVQRLIEQGANPNYGTLLLQRSNHVLQMLAMLMSRLISTFPCSVGL